MSIIERLQELRKTANGTIVVIIENRKYYVTGVRKDSIVVEVPDTAEKRLTVGEVLFKAYSRQIEKVTSKYSAHYFSECSIDDVRLDMEGTSTCYRMKEDKRF